MRRRGLGAADRDEPMIGVAVDHGGVTVETHGFAGLAATETLWRDVESRADAGFYLSWTWIGLWLRLSNAKPLVLVARRGARPIAVGLLTFARRRRHRVIATNAWSLHETGDPEQDVLCIEHNGFLCDRADRDAAEAALVDFLTCHRWLGPEGRRWDEMRFGAISDSLRERLAASGLATREISVKDSAFVDLGALRRDQRGYLDTLGSNTRYQIRRAQRLFAKRGELACDAAQTVAQALAFHDRLCELHTARWNARGQRGARDFAFLQLFHRTLIAEAHPRGEVDLLRIRAGESEIGYLYNFVRDRWVGYYLGGFVYEPDAKLKPGFVSHALAAERYLRDGRDVYDFLAGGESYKSLLGQPGVRMHWIDVQQPHPMLWIEGVARRLKSGLKKRRPLGAADPAATRPGAEGQ
jgi:CelD/BcsL family acetyltransferase involved in cellulose biosynthesis